MGECTPIIDRKKSGLNLFKGGDMSGVYVGGKLVSPEQEKRSRIYFIQGLLGYLYFDLKQFKAAVELQHAKSPVPKKLQNLICQYCAAILRCADGYPTNSGKVTKRGCTLVKQLRRNMLAFDRAYSKLLPQCRISQKKHQIICDLNWAVSWFVTQHDMTVSAVRVSTPVPPVFTKVAMDDFIKKEKIALKATNTSTKILAHRPKNWELVEVFTQVTTQYKKIHGQGKFLTHKKFCKELVAHNKNTGAQSKPLKVSERTYYSLKQAWINGSLEKFA
jgi:hypothetical protein